MKTENFYVKCVYRIIFLKLKEEDTQELKTKIEICKFCDLKEVEDEFHFFFRCKNNHTLRNILYKDINGICPKFNEYDS